MTTQTGTAGANDFEELRSLSPAVLFEALDPEAITIVAVSGGSDSMALLLLAHAWASANEATLHAVTIDHGLRPEAAAEAAYVAAVCDQLGIDHTTLGWDGIKPSSGIASAARMARYRLMADFAEAIGADHIVTGHTRDDQAETVAMRLEREAEDGNGRGLAAMATSTLLPGGLRLSRPLLGVSRARLRNYLRDVSQPWIEDPSNEDEAYERVRVRKALAGDPLRVARLCGLARVLGRLRAAVARDTANLLSATVTMEPGPVFLLDHGVASHAPKPVLEHALSVMVAVAGGREQFPSPGKVKALVELLARGEMQRQNLGGAVIEMLGGHLRFYRERRNQAALMLGPGEAVLWDGRVEIVNHGRDPVHAGPASRERIAEFEEEVGRRVAVRPRAALLSTLLIGTINGEASLPLADAQGAPRQLEIRLTAQAIEDFCPQTDLPLLEWLHGLDSARNAALQPRD